LAGVQALKKNEIINSPITIGDKNEFKKEAVIGHGAKLVKQEIHVDDGSRKYSVSPPNVSNIEIIAKILINRIGKKWTLILDLLTLIGTFLGIPIGLNSVLNTPLNAFTKNTIVEFIPKFPEFAMIILILGFLSFFAFLIITNALIYYRTSRCHNCERDFALIEYKPRKRRDTETFDAIHRQETKYTECRYCHDKKEFTGFFEFRKKQNENDWND
jgi:hypothetical protein